MTLDVQDAFLVPAGSLIDPEIAAWVHTHGVSVTASGDQDLDLLQHSRIRPAGVVYRCSPDTGSIRRAAAFGVSRFVVCSGQQIARVAQCALVGTGLYLDDKAPLMVGDRRLEVLGLHAEVGTGHGSDEWAEAARRLITRSAVLQACGTPVRRIVLGGASTPLWLDDRAGQADTIWNAVIDAVQDECGRRRVPEPAITLATLDVAKAAERKEVVKTMLCAVESG